MNDNNHADALYVRGLCRYYNDNQDAAFQHFQKVLRLAPDHKKAKDTYKVTTSHQTVWAECSGKHYIKYNLKVLSEIIPLLLHTIK